MALRAYRNLGVDGLVALTLPVDAQDYRGGLTAHTIRQREERYPTPESVLEYVEALPEPEQVADTFDADAYYEEVVSSMQAAQTQMGAIVHMPARWHADGFFMWYATFGYESYLGALGLYPDRMRKLFEHAAQQSRLQNELLARAYDEHNFCKLLLIGQDICGQTGPMVSPKWLQCFYFPLGRLALRPLLDSGFKIIWHSDGHILPILDLILELGVSGFQGFQWETGTTVDIVAQRKTIRGEPLLFFGGYSATRTLVTGTPDDVRREIEHYLQATGGRLFLFSTTSINPDAKLENIEAAFAYSREHPLS